MKLPCKGCEYRVLGCHSTCAAYIKYNNHQMKLRETRNIMGDMIGYVNDRNNSIKKRMGKY